MVFVSHYVDGLRGWRSLSRQIYFSVIRIQFFSFLRGSRLYGRPIKGRFSDCIQTDSDDLHLR